MMTGYGESAPKGCEPTKVRGVALVLGYKLALIMVPGAARSILSNKLYTTGYTA